MDKYNLFNTIFYLAEYIRLSKEDGDKAESDSVGNQKKLIADYLRGKEDFIVYDTYVDDGFSGTNFNRPAFRRMIDDIEAGKVNCVIVKDLSRFGRDYIETGKYLERYFPDKNVRFISITDNIDSWEQTYDMLLPIKNIFNEQYARDISKKIHASVQTKQKAGEFIGAFASYGYKKSPADKNKLIIDEYAAGVVRKIFGLYIKGYGKTHIASILNEEGIVSPTEYKRLNGLQYSNPHRLNDTSFWTYSTINRILQNEMYAGNMVQGRRRQRMRSKSKLQERKDWIIVQGTHEAIVDQETWERTQDLLKRRTRKLDFSNQNIFAGFIKCGDCGRSLVKKIRTKDIKFYCGSYVHSGSQFCTPHAISYQEVAQIILNDLQTIIRSIDNLKELIVSRKDSTAMSGRENRNEKVREQIQTELDRVRRLKKAVYEDFKEELISKEEFVAYRQDYTQKEEMLIKQLESLEEKEDHGAAKDMFEMPWIKRLLEFREVECLDREIIVEMLHEIRVYEDHRIKIVYNFSDELENLFMQL